jgi:hypothetical protein
MCVSVCTYSHEQHLQTHAHLHIHAKESHSYKLCVIIKSCSSNEISRFMTAHTFVSSHCKRTASGCGVSVSIHAHGQVCCALTSMHSLMPQEFLHARVVYTRTHACQVHQQVQTILIYINTYIYTYIHTHMHTYMDTAGVPPHNRTSSPTHKHNCICVTCALCVGVRNTPVLPGEFVCTRASHKFVSSRTCISHVLFFLVSRPRIFYDFSCI